MATMPIKTAIPRPPSAPFSSVFNRLGDICPLSFQRVSNGEQGNVTFEDHQKYRSRGFDHRRADDHSLRDHCWKVCRGSGWGGDC